VRISADAIEKNFAGSGEVHGAGEIEQSGFAANRYWADEGDKFTGSHVE